MTHFAVRYNVGPASLDQVERLARMEGEARGQATGTYWLPSPGQVLAVYEGELPAPPEEAAGAPEAFPVVPVTAEEYGPPGMRPAAGAGDGLQLVVVRRQLEPGIEKSFRAIALQAIMCAHEYTDLLWLRSYWATNSNELHCVFRTRTHDLVREHAQRSRIPCDEVHDAIEL